MDQKAWVSLAVLGLSLAVTSADRISAVKDKGAPVTAPAASAVLFAHRKVSNFDGLPIRFEPNVGQAPSHIAYLARGSGYSMALTQQGVILALRQGESAPHAHPTTRANIPAALPAALLRLSLVRALPKPQLRPEQPQDSVSNYFVGNDRSKWHSHVPNYAAVRYEQVYPGIDWVIYGNHRRLEYDFVVAPQTEPRRINLKIDGAEGISVDGNGDLLVKVNGTVLRQLKPVVYQTAADGGRRNIDGRYVLHHRHFGFEVGKYDRNLELVIDPAFAYSTFLGGSDGGSEARTIAVDRDGNAYVAGYTFSTDFPTLSPLQADRQSAGASTAFVTKLYPSGTAIAYSTYLGGSGTTLGNALGDVATAIAVDSSGAAYIAGFTYSTDFPILNAYQSVNHAAAVGGSNAFVTKMDPGGTRLVYSTYLGGSGVANPNLLFQAPDGAVGIAVDGSGAAYVAGSTDSSDFPTVNAFQQTQGAAFVTKLNASGNALVYSTYLGPGLFNYPSAIAVDSGGSAYVVGGTASSGFPVVAAFQPTNHSVGFIEQNAFVAKFNPAGNALAFSTYLGGSGVDGATAVAVDAMGSVYVCGYANSKDFPLVRALQASNNTQTDTVFITKFNPSGSGLVFSTYLGGSIQEVASGIAIDGAGDAYVTGSTYSTDFPTANALQSSNSGTAHSSANAFIFVLSGDGSTLEFSTYLGGSGSANGVGDYASGITVDSAGNIYIAGTTYSADFPTVMAFQGVNQAPESGSGFVTKIAANFAPERPSGGGSGGGRADWYLLGVLGLSVAARHLKRPMSTSSRSTLN